MIRHLGSHDVYVATFSRSPDVRGTDRPTRRLFQQRVDSLLVRHPSIRGLYHDDLGIAGIGMPTHHGVVTLGSAGITTEDGVRRRLLPFVASRGIV